MNDKDFELLDIKEQAEQVGKLKPIEYAKLRKMKPQLVYYYMRTGVLKEEICVCGARVIDVAKSDEALQAQKNKRGRGLDSRPDSER